MDRSSTNESGSQTVPVQYIVACGKPTLWDTAAPICRSGGACDRLAEEIVHQFARNSLGEDRFEEDKTCDWCGGKTDIKMCTGCKTLGYCSKGCQAKGWPLHKENCMREQEERVRLRAENTNPSATIE